MKGYQDLVIYCDGGARGNPGPAAVGVVIKTDNGIIFKSGCKIGESTNNVAEYRSVIWALEILKKEKISARRILFKLDSSLVVNQLNQIYKIRKAYLLDLLLKVRLLEREVGGLITYYIIPREQNREADFEVNRALDQPV